MINGKFDVIIVGAGPTGLASAFFNAKNGKKVLVLEKEDRPGVHPRGETLHDNPILDELMGPGVIKSLEIYTTADRLYHSPNNEKDAKRIAKTPSIVFEWEKFIKILYNRAKDAGNIEFRFNTEVLGPIYSDESGSCEGVFTNNERFYSHTVIGANGHDSSIGRSLGVLYETELNFPMIKCLVDNFSSDYTGFEYFFFTANQFSEFPSFPPGVAFIFPRGGSHAEIGIMMMTNITEGAKNNSEISNEDIMKFWQYLKNSLPGFSDRIKDAKTIMEEPTRIPVSSMIKTPMMRPGLFLIGDSAGFVEASGGSGLIAGIEAAKLTAQIIESQNNEVWTKESQTRANTTFTKSKLYKHLKKVYKMVGTFQNFLFSKLKTPEKINEKWKLVEIAYQMM